MKTTKNTMAKKEQLVQWFFRELRALRGETIIFIIG